MAGRGFSTHPSTEKDGQEKIAAYKWGRVGDGGKFQMIPITDLKVDHTYQRPEVSETNTLNIARNWNQAAAGVLVVMQRGDKELFIIEGQQRWLAAKRRGDITHLPCIVFKSTGIDGEADAFLLCNVARKPVSSIAKFNAAVLANREPQISISRWLTEHHLKVGSGTHRNAVDFVTTLVNLWRVDAEASKKALVAQQDLRGDDSPHGTVYKGFWYLFHNGIESKLGRDRLIEKILREGGSLGVLASAKRMQIEMQARTVSDKLAGLAILALINKRKSNKIILERKDDGK